MVKEPGGEERGGPKNTGWREENMAPSFAAAAECGAPQVQISAAPHACHSTEEKSSADGLSWLHTVQHPCVFGAARISLHLPPPASARVQQPLTNSNRTEPNQIKSNQQRLTFLLSHLFVLPRAAEQHQPHPLSGRESVSCARQMPGVRPPPQQQQPAALVLCRCASASPCGGSGASLRAALHSRQRPTDGAADWLRKKERRPTSDAAWMTDAFV